MAVRLSDRLGSWLRRLTSGTLRCRAKRVRRVPRVRRRRRNPADLRLAVAAYREASRWGERMSRFAQEAVEVPAYEERALRGERSPDRFCWRGRWYRVVEVTALWRDGRRRAPGRLEYGRFYLNVRTAPEGLFQIYYERSAPGRKGQGRWILYRQTEIRPGRG